MPDINKLRLLNKPESIVLTEHARIRLFERKITVSDVIKCIETGEIIKQYQDDKPLPSCLILGFTLNNQYIHVVVSNDEQFIYLITAYYPDIEKWEADFKTRKGKSL